MVAIYARHGRLLATSLPPLLGTRAFGYGRWLHRASKPEWLALSTIWLRSKLRSQIVIIRLILFCKFIAKWIKNTWNGYYNILKCVKLYQTIYNYDTIVDFGLKFDIFGFSFFFVTFWCNVYLKNEFFKSCFQRSAKC